MRRDRGRGGGAAAGRARPDPVEHRAVADRRPCGVRRRGAGDRGARPCRGARPPDRPRGTRGRPRLQPDRRGRGGGRARADRRRHRRAHHRQGDRAGADQAADRRQPPGGARAHGAAHRLRAVPVLPVPRLGRPYPDRRDPRRRRLRAARHHARRRDRRGVRQDRQAARARLSGRPAGRGASARRRRGALRAAAADVGPGRLRFLAVRTEDRAAARSREGRADRRRRRLRPVRLVPAGGGRDGDRPAALRPADVPRHVRDAVVAGRGRWRRRQPGDPQDPAPSRVRGRYRAGGAAAGAVHRQRRDDRLGGRRAAGARTDRHARRRAARALAARGGRQAGAAAGRWRRPPARSGPQG